MTTISTMEELSRLHCEFERIPAEVVQEAAKFQAATLADVAGRRGALNGRIAPLDPAMRLAGPAFTVEVRPGDNLMIHAAIALAQPGDVLVIDGKADQSCALMGAIMINACIQRGLAGVVVDGAVRDREEIVQSRFPVFSVGTNPNGPTKSVGGRLNRAISVGAVVVRPGDLVVGDADGVVVIDRAEAAGLLPLVKEKTEDERKRIESIQSGASVRPKWLEDSLRGAGVLAPE